eukprot:jgi/Tetstr1/429326/TSEL_019244.t1
MQHRAAVYRRAAAEGVALGQRERPPSPRAGQILARVVCAGVNPVDAKFVVCDKLPGFLQPLARRLLEGRTPGLDFSGLVEEAPPGSGFAPGDEVYGTAPPFVGSLQELVAVPVHQVAAKPASLSFQEAAGLPLVGLTALQALRDDHGLRAGQRLVVLGASGGVGHVAVQVGKALGAHVTGVCGAANARFVTERCGADEVVDYRAAGGDGAGVAAALGERASRAGAPFDLVLDCVSSHDPRDAAAGYEAAIRGARFHHDGAGDSGAPLVRGTYVCIGGVTSDWLAAGLKRTTGLSAFSAGRELFWVRFPHSAPALADLARMADSGALQPSLARVLPFTEAGLQEAFAALNSRRTAGKIVMNIGTDAPEAAPTRQ